MEPTKILYSISAMASGGGRDGKVKTSDNALDLTMAHPKEMGGTGNGNTPIGLCGRTSALGGLSAVTVG